MAMYTKMTPTGSSLVLTPRSISKELEAKIATSIASVIAKHDASKLTTKLVRQAVEKDVHVSLTNHKELLKRLMHQEFRKVKAAKVAKRVAPVVWKSKARRDGMRKGLNRVYAMLRDDAALFTQHGLHAIATLYDLQTVESGDVHQLAVLYTRLLGALWLKRAAPSLSTPLNWAAQQPSTPTVPTLLTPERVIETLQAVFIVERLGISHPQRVEFLEFFERAVPAFSVEDYIGWNPAAGPPVTDAAGSAYAKLANALLGTYMAHLVSVSLGTTVAQLLAHVPSLYPFKAPTELSAIEYRDQVLLATTVVAVVTKFGSLSCEPELLPHEYVFLRQHLVYHLSRQDIVLVSETLRAVKSFDGAENLVQVRRGMAFLVQAQESSGAWTNAVEPDVGQTYFATLYAVTALSEPKTVGFAPSLPELAPLLEQHLNADVSAYLEQHVAASQAKSSTSSSGSSSAPTPTPAAAATSAALDTGASHEDLQTQVLFLQGMLEKDGGNVKSVSAALATHVVSTLAGLTLTVEILKTTGVGRVINKLRKHASPDVAKSATQLVAQWKKDLL